MDGNYNLNVQPIQTIVAMKKILSVFCIATFLFASCSDEYDDSKLWQNVNDLKDRIAKLEETVQTMNSEIGSIQSIVNAINDRDYIVKIEELTDKSGYSITFAKGNTITIKHGKDGNDGKNAPIIGIDLYEGIYYWTITTDDEKTWLLDHNGNKLKVSGVDGKTAYDLAIEKGYEGTLEEWLESLKGSNGKSAYELAVENEYSGTIEEWLESLNGTNGKDGSDGSDGEDGKDGKDGKDGITPILGVDSDGYWTIDTGNGVQRLKDANGEDVKAIGQDGTDGQDGVDGNSFFNDVRYDENSVYFTFPDGKTISIPLSKGVSFTVTGVSSEQLFEYGETRTFDIVQNNIDQISISKPDGWKVSVLGDVLTVIAPPQENTFAEESGEIAITAMGTDSKSFIMESFMVMVDETLIPIQDAKFKKYLLDNFDKDGNGSISQPEANDIISIDCSGLGITSITEVKNFPNLESLNCSNNPITTLDISNNNKLTNVNCQNCNIKYIKENGIPDSYIKDHNCLFIDDNNMIQFQIGDIWKNSIIYKLQDGNGYHSFAIELSQQPTGVWDSKCLSLDDARLIYNQLSFLNEIISNYDGLQISGEYWTNNSGNLSSPGGPTTTYYNTFDFAQGTTVGYTNKNTQKPTLTIRELSFITL